MSEENRIDSVLEEKEAFYALVKKELDEDLKPFGDNFAVRIESVLLLQVIRNLPPATWRLEIPRDGIVREFDV